MISDGPGRRRLRRSALSRLSVVGARSPLGHVDVAVGRGQHARGPSCRRLAPGGELGHRAAGRRLGGLAAGVGVDLGVQHQDVDVAPRGQHVVEAAEADVVGPAVAADDPDALADEVVGHASRSAGAAARRRSLASFCGACHPAPLRGRSRPRRPAALEERVDQLVAELGRSRRQSSPGVARAGRRARAAGPGRTRRCPRRASCTTPAPGLAFIVHGVVGRLPP